jgi:hypothetical protein
MDMAILVEVGFEADSEIYPSVRHTDMEEVESQVGGWLIACAQHDKSDEFSGAVTIERREQGCAVAYVAYHQPSLPGGKAEFISSLTIIGDIPPGMV